MFHLHRQQYSSWHSNFQRAQPDGLGSRHHVHVKPARPGGSDCCTYWIEIQANMTFGTQGEWDWTDRMMQANSGAAFRNPGSDVGCGTDWIRKIFCVASMDPDQVYRLNGDDRRRYAYAYAWTD